MLLNKIRNMLLPKRILLRLSIVNILVITAFVGLSSWAIYNTACVLADGFLSMNDQKQAQFEATLLNYLWIFSISAIIFGSLILYYLTKKVIQPLRELIHSTKQMKQGYYPSPISDKSEGEIGELIAHFNEMINQLKENEQQRLKLVTDLSHEFRTPLANLNGYLRALQKGVIKADDKLYQSLYEESKRIIDLVEQMEQLKEMDYQSSQTFSEKSSVDIKKLVKQSVDMFRWEASKSNIDLILEVSTCFVTVNNGAISQVIANLLDNAIRYYEGRAPITVKGEQFDNDYKLSIIGPGKAIPKSERERIFSRFYRIEQSRSRESGGSGLGLAISKEIIEHHGGEIGVMSKKNVHEFWFTLPLKNF